MNYQFKIQLGLRGKLKQNFLRGKLTQTSIEDRPSFDIPHVISSQAIIQHKP